MEREENKIARQSSDTPLGSSFSCYHNEYEKTRKSILGYVLIYFRARERMKIELEVFLKTLKSSCTCDKNKKHLYPFVWTSKLLYLQKNILTRLLGH
jgi:hypothetical protein